MATEDPTKMPTNRAGEFGLVAVRAVASLIPFAGGPAAEVLGAIIAPSVQRRTTEWLEGIARGLADLEAQIAEVTHERLAQSEEFTTAFLHASQVAVRTHQREKRDALRNAVLNVAAGRAPSEDLQILFFYAVDALTPSHLQLLRYFDDPGQWPTNGQLPPNFVVNTTVGDMLERAIPDLRQQRQWYGLLYDDLARRGFVEQDQQVMHMVGGLGVCFARRTTYMGRQFLEFITSPIPAALTGGS